MHQDVKIVGPGRLEHEGHVYDTFEFVRCLDFQYTAEIEAAGAPAVRCTLSLWREDNFVLRLSFEGVTYLQFPELAPSFWISEFEVVDARSRQLEGTRYVVSSGNGFVCHCIGVRLGTCGPLPPH